MTTHEISLTSELWVTEVSNLFISSSLPDSAEREIAFCPSIRLTSWSLWTQLEKSSLRLLTSSNPSAFHSSAKMSETALWFSFLLFYLEHSPRCTVYPFIFSLTAFFFFFFGSVRTLSTWLLLLAVPRRVSLLHWPLLISKVLRVSSCSLNNAPRSQSGADRPRAGHSSWSFILLTWVSLICEDICGPVADFEYLWCAHLILIRWALWALYSKRNQMKKYPSCFSHLIFA